VHASQGVRRLPIGRNARKEKLGMGRILIVDGEASMRRLLASNLRQDQHEIWEASGVQGAQRALTANDFDVVVTDQKLPDGEGLAVLASAHEGDPTIPVILLTTVATLELAVEVMRRGAFDLLPEPFQPELVRATVRRARERTRLLRENILLKNAVVRLEGASEIYGESQAMCNLRDREGASAGGNGADAKAFAVPVSDFFDLNAFLEGAEKELIVRTLTSTHGAQAEAARRMGLSRSALAYKLTKYGIRSAEIR
jgi:DNA-binding NtrC family response regulator